MQFLFAPAVTMMNRMRFATRFVLIGAAGGLLIAGLLFEFLQSVGERRSATEREIQGIRHVMALRQISQSLDRHLLASSLYSLGESSSARGRQSWA